ncbi:MAG: hypothetical protein IJP54_09040, partial [Synergistaceae bacterium]|nr:hypothetical protein [Synergistaceae bacterium]
MINNSIQVFDYEDFTVRTYTDKNGEVWLVAKDVCNVLGIQNHRDAISGLDDDEVLKGVGINDSSELRNEGSVPTLINEAGLYRLTFRSRKPAAKKFTRWVTHEVLPSIRKTGSYTIPEKRKPAVIVSQDKKPLPQTSAPIKAADKIYTQAFKAKTDKDFQAVLALDQAFIDTFGRSALEIAGLRIEQTLIEVSLTYKERLYLPRERNEWTKWVNAYVLIRNDQIVSSSVDERSFAHD